MDPKLLRMYSDILNEQGFAQQYALRNTEDPSIAAARQQATASSGFNWRDPFGRGAAVRAQQGGAPTSVASAPAAGTAAAVRSGQGGRSTTPLPGDPNAPAYKKDPGQTKKVGTGASGFPVAGQGGRPTPKPPVDSMAARGRVDAMRGSQASASQTDSSSYGPPTTPATAAAPAAQTTPDQMRTTTAVGASNIGFTGPETPAPAPAGPMATPTMPATSASPGGPTTTTVGGQDPGRVPTVTSSSGAPVTTGSGGTLRSRSADEIAATGPMGITKPMQENELEEEVEESIDQELEEAFNEMLRLSGIQLNEKAPPGAKAERMVKHIKKGYAKDGKLSDKEKSIAFATAWKAKKAGKLDEGFRVMMDEEGHTLEHIVNRFKHEAKTFLNTGEMSDKLYDALYDYYLDRGEMPYGIAKAREGDPYTWVAARFEADIDGTVDVKMPSGEVGGDDTLNELARLAGLSESQVNECGDMGMDTEDRLNVSTNMSSDGTRSVNISAQGEKAEELLSMLKLAGMGGSDRPAMVMVDKDEEMMDEERETEYANTPREKFDNIETQFIGGDGEVAGKEKRMHAGGSARFSDNPLAVDEMLGEEWAALYDSILVKKEMEEGSIKGGDKPGELTGTWSADPPKKGQPNVPPPVPMDPVYPAEKPKATPTPGIKR